MFGSLASMVSRRFERCPLFREPNILGPTDGSRTIARATDIFTGGIGNGFGELDVPSGEVTPEMHFFLCSRPQGIDCRCIPSLTRESVAATQHQLVNFGEEYLSDLFEERGMEIWFPFRSANNLYLAGLYLRQGHPAIRLIPLPSHTSAAVVRDGYHRVVILQYA